jgi:putative Mg2+ transporter-C (MgtC) family protein
MSGDFSLYPLDWKAILVAIICGLIIGFERQWQGKTAGIRTSILICLSAYIFVTIGQMVQPEAGAARVVGQIVTGVGFLGAGVILARDGLIRGVTSASVIWVLAAIGSLIGLGRLFPALVLAVITVLILTGMTLVEKFVKKLKRGVHRE